MKTHHALIRSSWLLASLAACSNQAGDHRGGALDLGLQVGPNATLADASFTIEGPNGFVSAGNVSVGESPDVPIVLGHLPVGQGYEVAIEATASDGATVCQGRTGFDVTDANAVFTVLVHLECAIPTGSVDVQASLNVCPVVDGVDASPMDLKLGGVSRLTLLAHDSDTGPTPLAYSWLVNGIKLTRQTSPMLSFACSAVGANNIAGVVSDGDPNPACADSSAVKVNCQ